MTVAMKASERRLAAIRRETPSAKNLPYEGHLTRTIIDTTGGDLLCVLRVGGASMECADDSVINNRHNRLNRAVMSLADPRIATWQHIVKTEQNQYPDGDFPPGYARELNDRYRAKIGSLRLMANYLYLTVVLRPHRTRAEGVFANLVVGRNLELHAKMRQQHVAELEDIVRKLVSSLSYYDAEPLGVYERNGVLFSDAASYLQFLATGRWTAVPLARVPLRYLIGGVRPVFGNETVEVRNPSSTHFCAVLGIHSYPEKTSPMFLEDLLSLPFELVVTQSFEFKSKDEAMRGMTLAHNRMESAGDAATSQIDEIVDAKDDVASRRSVAGAHHYNVLVKASTLEELRDNIADVDAVLTDAGIKPAREDLASESAYWAQMPGNFSYRPRLSPINSRNLCGFIPLHNFPTGRRKGNHWGDALTILLTNAGTPFYFSLHGSDPRPSSGGKKSDVGNLMLIGPTGAGKTAKVAFTLMMLQKFGVTSVLFSTDRDTEIAVRRLRGKVYRLRLNEPSGLAPFALDPEIVSTSRHLHMLVRRLIVKPVVTETGAEVDTMRLSVLDEKRLDGAIDSVLRLPREARRLGRVLDFLPKGDMYERLARWCYAREPGREDGPLAWVFDNTAGTIAEELGSATTTAFDTTAYLDDPELRIPINMHLLHLTTRLVDGRRFALFVSEFWKPLADAYYAAYFRKALKTVRKLDGLVILDTQSPSDALALPIARTLIEQCPTLILFPNDKADKREYLEFLNCSEREFDLVKKDMPEGQGFFLLKQGKHSIVCRLPLDGMEDDMAVLSARSTSLELMDRLIKEHGENPDSWVPHFNRERK